jgi:hypothetical protein
MLLFKKNLDSILIVSKFNLHNFKYLVWVFGQILIINIPLLNIEIGRLQCRRQSLFFSHEEFLLSPPLSLSLLEYSKVMAHHLSTVLSLVVQTKCCRYSSSILHYIEDEDEDVLLHV